MPYSDLSSFGFKSTEDFLERSAAVWNPDKVRFWREAGTPLIIGRREHYYLFDLLHLEVRKSCRLSGPKQKGYYHAHAALVQNRSR